MASKTQQAVELAIILASEPNGVHRGWHLQTQDVMKLRRLAAKAQRLAEIQCNGVPRYDTATGRLAASWNEKDQERHDKAIERLRRDASAIAAHYQAEVIVSGDPRGACLKLKLPSGRSNSFAGGVWCV